MRQASSHRNSHAEHEHEPNFLTGKNNTQSKQLTIGTWHSVHLTFPVLEHLAKLAVLYRGARGIALPIGVVAGGS